MKFKYLIFLCLFGCDIAGELHYEASEEHSFIYKDHTCTVVCVNAMYGDVVSHTVTKFVVCDPPIPGMYKGSQAAGKGALP